MARKALAGHRRQQAAGEREADKRLEGKDGWLFLHNDSNDVIGQHTGRVLRRRQLDAWRALFQGKLDLTAELGCTWLCTIVPDKESVYTEYLPDSGRARPATAGRPDPRGGGRPRRPGHLPPFGATRGQGRTARYSVTGTHWTHVGAHVAYETICRELSDAGVELDVIGYDEIVWREFQHPVEGDSVRGRPKTPQAQIVFDNRVFNHGRTIVFERDDGVGPTAVFGESFTVHLLTFLKESFRRLVFVHTSTMPREILERERPDVVLTCPTERFMVKVPTDGSAIRQIAEEIRIKRQTGAPCGNPGRRRGIPGSRASPRRRPPWPDLIATAGPTTIAGATLRLSRTETRCRCRPSCRTRRSRRGSGSRRGRSGRRR